MRDHHYHYHHHYHSLQWSIVMFIYYFIWHPHKVSVSVKCACLNKRWVCLSHCLSYFWVCICGTVHLRQCWDHSSPWRHDKEYQTAFLDKKKERKKKKHRKATCLSSFAEIFKSQKIKKIQLKPEKRRGKKSDKNYLEYIYIYIYICTQIDLHTYRFYSAFIHIYISTRKLTK